MSRVDALKESCDEWNEAFQSLTLKPLSELVQVKTPTFFELVEENRAPAQTDRPKGLYEDLLNARPEALYLHAIEHKEDFNEVLPLLNELVNGKSFKDITLEEQKALDAATMEFVTYVPSKKKDALRSLTRISVTVPTEPPPIPGVDVPEGTVRPYWWLE
jgi:hypothetical protein